MKKKRFIIPIVVLIISVIAGLLFARPASAYTMRQMQIRQANSAIIMDVFGQTHGPKAIRVANCESKLGAVRDRRGSQFKGLFQIGSRVHGRMLRQQGLTQLSNPRVNARAAFVLWNSSGWRPWSCRRA